VEQEWPPRQNSDIGLPDGLELNFAALYLHYALATPAYVPAVVSCREPEHSCSYGNLNSHVIRQALRLREEYDVKDGRPVAILMEKSPRYVVALLATLLAGGSYVPLSPSDPPSLRARVVSDCNIAAAFIGPGLSLPGARAILVEEQLEQLQPITEEEVEKAQAMAAAISPEQQACIVYSSGTTGNPKGICIPHRALVVCYTWRFTVTRPKRWGGSRVACNIFFVWEALRPFLRGATCVVIPDDVIFDPPQLLAALEENRVTEWLSTPSLFESVVQVAPPATLAAALRTLRVLFFNGEVVRPALAQRTLEAIRSGGNSKARVYNLYSISECHEVSIIELTPELLASLPEDAAAVPTGHLAPFVNALVIDHESCQMPADGSERRLKYLKYGEVGRLFVGGPGLAIGYHGNEKLTDERFPTLPGLGRVYDTGDLVRIDPPKEGKKALLRVLGRGDSMVKIRGYSVVLGAVETMINRTLGTEQSCVIAEGAEGTDKRLVAYIVLPKEKQGDWTIDPRTGACPMAHAALKHHLPLSHIPSVYVSLSSMPVHAVSGKTNQKALPPPPPRQETVTPDIRSAEAEAALMGSVSVAALQTLFAETVGVEVDTVGAHDDFFSLGGHSLLAAMLIVKIQRCNWTSRQLKVSDIFQHPTPTALCDFISSLSPSRHALSSPPANVMKELSEEEKSRRDEELAKTLAQVDALFSSSPPAPSQLTGGALAGLPDNSSVLVTGASGYVGSSVVAYIQSAHPSLSVVTLLRSKAQAIAGAEPLVGDLSQPLLGLSEEEFQSLRERIAVVIHCAASVNLVAKASSLWNVNVAGTIELLRLGRPMRFVSSSAAHPLARDGYGWTKHVAERAVMHAASAHGLDATFVRPVDIAGVGSRHDHRFLCLQAVVASGGTAPAIKNWRWRANGIEDVIACLAEGRQELPPPFVCDISTVGAWMRDIGYQFHLSPLADDSAADAVVEDWLRALPQSSPIRLFHEQGLLEELCTAHDPHERREEPSRPYPRELFEAELSFARAQYFPAPLPLLGHCAFVTGASSGIGAAAVRRLLQAGARVFLTSRRGIAPEDAVRGFKEGLQYSVGSCDVRDLAGVEAAVAQCTEELGPPSVVVNNAGVMYFTLMRNCRLKEWQQTVDTICTGAINVLYATLPHLLARKSVDLPPHFVSVTSDAGRKAFAGLAVYSGAKFFVEAMTTAMREEFAAEPATQHMRVSNIQPGNVKTSLLSMSSDPEALEQYGGPTPNCRVLDPDDVARSLVHVLTQPPHCSINEILVEPRLEPI